MELSFLQVSIAIMALAVVAQTSLAFPDTGFSIDGDSASPPLQHAGGKSDSVKEFLAGHNAARASVGVPPLRWNATVAAYAEAYAAQRSADCALEHSEGPYGENIAEGYGELSAVDSVKMWVGEKPNYDYASNSCVSGECLHYTQVVWRNTMSIGCARAACHNGWMFVTCNYYPPGNYEGERPY
ncbi:pathogenesis-related protein 1A-like [Ipomoea triloba]|uniref:pathogenesis-related protein 1A-like n=1 Tax=Ipomoea triloba TaxID=35885 RepID=UPI00125DE604|nr:pathogenesis-related protein 1A-like [Ipomoea triloba]